MNSQPLTSTSLAPLDELSINSKLNHKNAAEERIKKKLKKAKQAVRKRRPRWLKVTMQNFSTFCNQTSLHGWQYIAQSHTSSLKHVFWALIVSLSMATAAIFLYNNTMDYLHATVRKKARYAITVQNTLANLCIFMQFVGLSIYNVKV